MIHVETAMMSDWDLILEGSLFHQDGFAKKWCREDGSTGVSPIDRVPIVRIFGSTPSGQKTCVHIRKAFPYFYVPYGEDLPLEVAEVQRYLRRMANAIDMAMNATAEPGAPHKQHVHTVQLVRAYDFYGFHADQQLFMKIIMYNPMEIGKASRLLQAGSVGGCPLQPFEAHIPFLLQFKIDFNLSGMGFVRFSAVKFRGQVQGSHEAGLRRGWRHKPVVLRYEPGPHSGEVSGPHSPTAQHSWTSQSIPAAWMPAAATSTGHRTLEKESCCELEVDACIEDILNRQEVERRSLEEAGTGVRMVESLAPMWEEQRRRNDGATPLRAPSSPPRTPHTLSPFVTDAVRAQYQAIADNAAPSQPSGNRAAPADQSSGKSPSSTSRSSAREPLLQVTQAANLATDPATSSASLGPSALRRQADQPLANEATAPNDEGDWAAVESPFSPNKDANRHTQGSQNQEMHQLIEWLQDQERDDDASQDSQPAEHAEDEDADDDPLMQLAQEAFTPAPPRSSQAEALRKMTNALSGRASQSQRECNDILTCPTPAGLPARNMATGVFATPGLRPEGPRWGALSQDVEALYQDLPADWVPAKSKPPQGSTHEPASKIPQVDGAGDTSRACKPGRSCLNIRKQGRQPIHAITCGCHA
ncbi:hypothetical protein WJX73_009005 [Symbiochloris irregularis]|uniref:DNA polymerase zeta catalytic subunit n=1 Tax=Symbiochloris irregularis TaxID=706552 RepID=A0AAW1NZU9_9CHLO